MKILEFLACLSWLLPPAFAKFRPFAPLPSQSLDHPERIMEQRGQINCLDHNFQDLDILRRFEAHLFDYPELRVGCETFSAKPFRPSSQVSQKPKDSVAWLLNNIDNIPEDDQVPPRTFDELEDAVVKYFAIDMYGVETQVGPGSAVAVETYDLRQGSRNDTIGPVHFNLSTRLETFTFEQLCFPSVCYRPGDKKSEKCQYHLERFPPKDVGRFLVKCASEGCGFLMDRTLNPHRYSTDLEAPNVFIYCSLETSDGPLLGPLRTPMTFPGLPDLLNSSSPRRTQVSSDSYKVSNDQKGTSQLRSSTLFSSHYRADEYKDEVFITSCSVEIPLEAPLNTSFAVDFFVAENRDAVKKPIRPGHQVTLTGYRTEEYVDWFGDTRLRTHKVPLKVKFEDLCFPAECFQEPQPRDEAKCQFREPKGHPPAGALFRYVDPATGIIKLLWPTKRILEDNALSRRFSRWLWLNKFAL